MAKNETTIVQGTYTVTNSNKEMLAATKVPRDVFIQNNDGAGIIYIQLNGVAATASATLIVLKANANESILLKNIRNAVNVIGSIASNANVAYYTTR